MAFKGGFMKKMGNVITNATSDLLGEGAAEKLVDIKNSVQEKTDDIGVTDGIRKVTEAGSTRIQHGKEKLAEWSGSDADSNQHKTARDTAPPRQTIESMPNAVFMTTQSTSSTNVPQQPSAYEKYSNQADQLWKLKELLDLGILSPEEFEQKKRIILG